MDGTQPAAGSPPALLARRHRPEAPAHWARLLEIRGADTPQPANVVDQPVGFSLGDVPTIRGHLHRLPFQENACEAIGAYALGSTVQDPLADLVVACHELREIIAVPGRDVPFERPEIRRRSPPLRAVTVEAAVPHRNLVAL